LKNIGFKEECGVCRRVQTCICAYYNTMYLLYLYYYTTRVDEWLKKPSSDVSTNYNDIILLYFSNATATYITVVRVYIIKNGIHAQSPIVYTIYGLTHRTVFDRRRRGINEFTYCSRYANRIKCVYNAWPVVKSLFINVGSHKISGRNCGGGGGGVSRRAHIKSYILLRSVCTALVSNWAGI